MRPLTAARRMGMGALAAALLLVGGAARAQNDLVDFSKGALIIPEQSSYQTGCGVASAYGLVWRILQSNQPGGFNANHPVTVYWVINGTKGSPNRCVPSNLHTPPSPNSGWSDPKWNDGCDLKVHNTAEQPVVPVNYTLPFPTVGTYPDAPIPTYAATTSVAIPAYPQVTLDNAAGRPFTDAQYLGGPFVIDASDAANVIAFLQDAVSRGQTDISQFTVPCSCTSFPTNGCHYVQMHQATAAFSAYVAKRINQVPPKVAVLDSGNGVATGVLDAYLNSAGLLFTGSRGCPLGTFSGCTLNGGQPGLIYDQFNAIKDLISTASYPYGLLNSRNAAGKLIYRVFWTPHWAAANQTDSQYLANGDGASDERVNALNNIARFADQKGTGLMAECASIETYEGSYTGKMSSSGVVTQTTANIPVYTPKTNFMFNQTILENLLSDSSWDGRNCTDPDYVSGECVVYPKPGDPFAQLGDFHFYGTGGHVHNYKPNPIEADGGTAVYQPGVSRLATSWENYVPGDYPTSSSKNGDDGWDFFDLVQKDNDVRKATVVYLGGHTFSGNLGGTRLVLNTLLNLGADPISSERALSAPVAYEDPNGSDANGTRALVFASTFDAVSGYPTIAALSSFDPSQGSLWVFPLLPGHLRAHSLIGGNALATGESGLDKGLLWDANDKLPLPHDRNLFTYFGGYVTSQTAPAAGLSTAPAGAPHGVLQVGWRPENVAGTQLDGGYTNPNTGCVDVTGYAMVGPDGGTPALVPMPGGDGICDLQQALQSVPVATTGSGSTAAIDWSATRTALVQRLAADQQMLQHVRGYCFATTTRLDGSGTPVLEPADNQCNSDDDDNRAQLGGLVHSPPAIVPFSDHIADSGAHRPTVAYAGGYDGQLHAFYVSGGSGYTGPATPISPANPRPNAKFAHDYAADFANRSPPPPGTELWSFLPASQLPYLHGNTARVDSAPVVADVWADFDRSGIRSWHTVLVASIGKQGRELFALDVTNPLKPYLLWDLAGSLRADPSATFSPIALANGPLGPAGYAFKFQEPTATFQPPASGDPGASSSGLYDYSDLGGASGIALGQVRAGLEPEYDAFLATNFSGNAPAGSPGARLEVFAIDAVTGQKRWQWEEPYLEPARAADNTVPAPVSITRDSDGVNRVYAGDLEGRLWELDALSGRNVNLFLGTGCTASPCKFPAFDAYPEVGSPQPLTTNVATAVVPPGATGLFASYPNADLLIAGTAGADWVPSTVAGRLHVLLSDAPYRVPFASGGVHLDGTPWSQADALAWAGSHGVLQEPSGLPFVFPAGEHLYGAVTVSGEEVFFETAIGAVNDLLRLSGSLGGATHSLDLGLASSSSPFQTFTGWSHANFGGVTVFHDAAGGRDYVVGLEVSKIATVQLESGTGGGPGKATPNPRLKSGGSQGPLYRFKAWLSRFLGG